MGVRPGDIGLELPGGRSKEMSSGSVGVVAYVYRVMLLPRLEVIFEKQVGPYKSCNAGQGADLF